MTWDQWCQQEMLRHKIAVSEEEAGYILMNHTGFPSFFMGGDAKSWFSKQIGEFVRRLWAGESPSEQEEANLNPDL